MASDFELRAAGVRRISTAACQAAALDYGATLISWQPTGQREVLFFSAAALVGMGDEIHGGIPVCAPWFGRGREQVQVPHSHGLVRWLPWRLLETYDDGWRWRITGADTAHLPGSEAYPPDLSYELQVKAGTQLEVTLTVSSPSVEFVLDQALHAYYRVRDITDCQIRGLEGVRFRDDTGLGEGCEQHPVRVQAALDRVYAHSGPIELVDRDRRVCITADGASSVVVWNPGPHAGLAGMAEPEWREMVCIEVGNVQDQAVSVPAGDSHTLTLRVALG